MTGIVPEPDGTDPAGRRRRIVLLVTSPRLPAGLLTAEAWDLVRAHPVFTGAAGAQASALRAAGVQVTVVSPERAVAALLGAIADTRDAAGAAVVWLAGPAGDEDLARELGRRLTSRPDLADLELRYGSWDPPGARLLDAVAVTDRLRSPGGDPWKAEQTHASLARFLLEEAYEAYDAILAHDLPALREEIGDVLLQVLLHARLAEELPGDERWSIDDVAGDFVAKMIRRNPHVFAGARVADIDEITDNWEQIKRAEKARESALDGIAEAQPALSLAAKILQRARRAGLDVPLPPAPAADIRPGTAGELGAALLAVVSAAQDADLDAEAALRQAAHAYADAVRARESSTRP